MKSVRRQVLVPPYPSLLFGQATTQVHRGLFGGWGWIRPYVYNRLKEET